MCRDLTIGFSNTESTSDINKGSMGGRWEKYLIEVG